MKSADKNKLLIAEERPNNPEKYDYLFIIQEQLKQIAEEKYDEAYYVLSNADVDLDLPVPIYKIAWRHLITHRHGRLHELVLVYLRLEEVLETVNPDEVLCESSIDRGYSSVITDVCETQNVKLNSDAASTISSFDFFQRFLKNSLLIIPFLIDEILISIISFVYSPINKTETVFIPSLGRFGSMSPVLDRVSKSDYNKYTVAVLSKVSSCIETQRWKYLGSELDNHPIVPFSSGVTLVCVFTQIIAYIKINQKVLFGESLEKELDHHLTKELDIHLDETLSYAIYEGLRTRSVLSIFFYMASESLIRKTDCDEIIIGGLSPSRRAMMLSGIENSVEVYLIPHGAGVAGDSRNPHPELTHFVSGKLEKVHWENSQQVKNAWNMVVTGRPYLVDLYETQGVNKPQRENMDMLRILIATQPIRGIDEVIEEVIDSAELSDTEYEIIIKTHPSEAKSKYIQYTDRSEKISVVETGLFKHIQGSDLTITINSNVGVESIIAGTPTVCVNNWSPIINVPLYSRHGPVPTLQSPDEVDRFFEGLNKDQLSGLWECENDFVHEFFELETDAAQNMLEEILFDRYEEGQKEVAK